MAVWGHNSFENDAATDWLGELEHRPGLLDDALEIRTPRTHFSDLDIDDCHVMLAAAELVAAAHGQGDDRLDEEAVAWLAQHRDVARAVDPAKASRAVERVFEGSELREVWDEHGEDGDWHAGTRELLRRLSLATPDAAPSR
jgi:hypothetical protein